MSHGAIAAGGGGVLVAVPLLLVLLAGTPDADTADSDSCLRLDAVAVGGLDAEQSRNAAVIVAAGQTADVPAYGVHIALATAMQESSLRNLDHGDRDSLGLFQQRPSTGWGTPDQLTDPVYDARAFYGGPTGPNNGEPPGLLDTDGWHDMALTAAAQAVQRSAQPDAYARWEHHAATWNDALLADGGNLCLPHGGLDCPPTGHAAEDGLTPDALLVLRCIAAHFPQVATFHGVGDRPNDSDHPTGRAVDAIIPDWASPAGNTLGWNVTDWLRAHHACLGITYLIWDARIWSPDRDNEGWRPYEHPNGWTDANSAHHNHVHASVAGDSGGCVDGAWVVPIRGDYTITARFGQAGRHWTTTHTGLDLAAPIGRDVLAASAGQVAFVGWDGAYGLKVEIIHPGGIRTWYAHLSSITVDDGDHVAAGDVIGHVGTTGNSTGPHLHYEIRRPPRAGEPGPAPHGTPVDPEPWMTTRGATI